MNVLHVTQPTSAGVARHVLDLVEHQIQTTNAEVCVASPESEVFESALRSIGASWVRWNATRSPGRSVPEEARELARITASISPDLVHLHSSKAGLVGRIVSIDAPRLFTPNGWSVHAASGATRLATLLWERAAARRAATIICVSPSEHTFAQRHRIRGDFAVIPNAVDTTRVFPIPHDERERRAQALGLRPGLRVVCVGRLTRAKGQSLLLDAWPAVRSTCQSTCLYFVGEGEDEAELRSHPATDESVVFVGHSARPTDWLAVADLVVIPSRWDGLSYVLLEAMASGAPIVATRAIGAVDALGEGYGGLTSDAPPEIARAIVERLRDPALRDREGALVRERAVEQFDLSSWGMAHSSLYESVLAR